MLGFELNAYDTCLIHNPLGCVGGINVFVATCRLAQTWYSVTLIDALTREQPEGPVSSCNLWLGTCPATDAIANAIAIAIGDLGDYSFILPTKRANSCICTKLYVRSFCIWICKWLSMAIVSCHGVSYSNQMRVK